MARSLRDKVVAEVTFRLKPPWPIAIPQGTLLPAHPLLSGPSTTPILVCLQAVPRTPPTPPVCAGLAAPVLICPPSSSTPRHG